MKLNKYIFVAFIYFFVNSIALPFGLTYTALLAPLFYVWVIIKRKKEILLPFLAILLPFLLIHVVLVDLDISTYGVSLVNLVLVYIFCQAMYTFLLVCKDIEKVFRRILVINFIFCLIAIPVYFTPWFNLIWDEQVISSGVGRLRRLKLFTYEPSYYALLFTPVFCYFLLQYLFRQNNIKAILLLPMLFLPFVLSFSLGVITSLFLAGIVTWMIQFSRLTAKRRIANAVINGATVVASAIAFLVLFFRHNPFFVRVGNFMTGEDSSGRGRTIDAFTLAVKMLKDNNEFWGIGLGQVKIAGDTIIRNYYQYNLDIVVTIPNAAAETLAIFGWTGLVIRLLVEIFLFFYTRTWTNYYRLLLFCFMFIYQFTGSFITNIAEYVIWFLAFTNVFNQFDVKNAGMAVANGKEMP
jgi:hypothetical protein